MKRKKKVVAVIPCGGRGTRMGPYSKVLIKPLMPFGVPGINIPTAPILVHAIRSLVRCGITEIILVARESHHRQISDFVYPYFDREPDIHIHFVADLIDAKGPAHAAWSAHDKIVELGAKIIVIKLGDNYFYRLSEFVSKLLKEFDSGGVIVTKEVANPKPFGVVTLNADGKIVSIVEKPEHPDSNLVLTGLSVCDYAHFLDLDKIEPSGPKNEKFLTDAFNKWIKRGTLRNIVYPRGWYDIARIDDIFIAASQVYLEAISAESVF